MVFRFLAALLILASAPISGFAARRDSVAVTVAGGKVSGTLTLPGSKSKMPVALIIPSSGGVDRDGNLPMQQNYSLKQLSDSLAARGIASLRYDKRGVGASASLADERKLRFNNYAEDASAWLQWLRKQQRFDRIVVIGHGEGSLVGMMALQKTPADAFISVAGPGEPMDSLLMRQFTAQNQHQSTLDSLRMMFAELRKTGSVANVPAIPFYMSVFRPTVQRYLHSWISYNPAALVAGVKCPVLLIQGDNDLQMDTAQIRLLHQARPGARMVVIPGMNHIFRQAPEDAEGNIETTFSSEASPDPNFIREVADFILKN